MSAWEYFQMTLGNIDLSSEGYSRDIELQAMMVQIC